MKKILTIALTLVFALTLTIGASAIYGEDASGDDAVARAEAGIQAAAADLGIAEATSESFNELWNELLDLVPEAELVEILQGLLADIDLDNDLSDADRDYIVEAFISRMPIDAEGGLADRISNMMSNDFLSFLAGLYVPDIIQTTTAAPETTLPPPTGDSSVIAIAAFATVSVAAAAAFVLLKKKEK